MQKLALPYGETCNVSKKHTTKTAAIMKKIFIGALSLLILTSTAFCQVKQDGQPTIKHLQWAKNAVIYEVNTRQYTPEGTFKAMQAHLPRLKQLGVDILWFMPIHKIGVKDRKGELGSYYAVQDYKSINPEFGNLEDFKATVKEAHKLGLKVIIDWVANHTSRDSKWLAEHPEWFVKDKNGSIVAPFDWTDVAKLDYTNPQMRAAMVDAMKFWLTEANIDGFRCDVAGEVPTDFWNDARRELDKVKPVFMLAEAEKPELTLHAFDMDYAWNLHHIMNQIAQGKQHAASLAQYFKKQDLLYSPGTIRMNFTSNHDENSWNGTEFERMGPAAKTFAALCYLMPGMPLIYNGQEVAFNKRLEFFKKDPIQWNGDLAYTSFYQKLNQLKKVAPALDASITSSCTCKVDGNLLTIERTNDKSKVTALFNLGGQQAIATTPATAGADYLSGKAYKPGTKVTIEPWEFLIFVK
jgi:glycosidase